MRWPLHTGIGQVQEAYVARKPHEVSLVNLKVAGRIGSPLSPLKIASALWRARNECAVFWSAGFVPPLFGCRRAIIFVHDLTHLKYYGRLRRIYYALVLRALYARCAAVICVSDYTRAEFLTWSKMDPARVHVIKNGVPRRFVDNRLASKFPYKYVLYPGNHRPYKNLDRIVRAFAQSMITGRGIHLVLTGEEHPDLKRTIDECHLQGFVHFCGCVSSERLPQLYRGAEAVVFVSLYEGFGLPILEAMASHVPVVTSKVSAMPEVAGDAALLVDPHSVNAIASALLRITSDQELRTDLIAKGRQRLKDFDWDRSADRFWRLVKEVSEQVGADVAAATSNIPATPARSGEDRQPHSADAAQQPSPRDSASLAKETNDAVLDN
jgi:glycosyltransferase involved in cell wall biosynthesis